MLSQFFCSKLNMIVKSPLALTLKVWNHYTTHNSKSKENYSLRVWDRLSRQFISSTYLVYECRAHIQSRRTSTASASTGHHSKSPCWARPWRSSPACPHWVRQCTTGGRSWNWGENLCSRHGIHPQSFRRSSRPRIVRLLLKELKKYYCLGELGICIF